MNLIVEKTRKNDVSNTNGVFAAAHESVHGPLRLSLQCNDLSPSGVKQTLASGLPERVYGFMP